MWLRKVSHIFPDFSLVFRGHTLVQSNHKNTQQNNTSDDAEQQTLRACLLRTW